MDVPAGGQHRATRAPPWRSRRWPTCCGPGSCATTPTAPDWPDRDRFVLSAGHASILLYSMLYLTGYGLTLDDLEAFRQWGQPHARPPRGAPHHGRRGHHRPARPGLRQRRRHGHRRALPARPLRRRAVRPPHVRHLRRRRPRGGHQPRGRLARRPPRARPARLRLRRQPHHHRRPHRAGAAPTTPASASRPTAGTSTTSARSPTTSTRSRPRCAGPWPSRTRPSLLVLRSHIGWPVAEVHRHRARPRQPARRGRDRGVTKEILGSRRTRRSRCPTTCSTLYREAGPRGPRRARGVGEAARRAGTATAPRTRPASPAAGCHGWDDEAADVGRRREGRHPQGQRRVPRRRSLDVVPGLIGGGADLTGNTGTALKGHGVQSARRPGRPPDLLRRPRARHGRRS